MKTLHFIYNVYVYSSIQRVGFDYEQYGLLLVKGDIKREEYLAHIW